MRPRMLALALLAFASALLTPGQAAPGDEVVASARSAPAATGQWIWTARDRALFERSRLRRPSLQAAVLVGSVECERGSLRLRRGLSPLTSGPTPYALVVRLSDNVHACLAASNTSRPFSELDAELARLLTEVRASGATFTELQLDYDAPVSKLPRYAALLRHLKRHTLRDTELWITSIPVHVQHAAYGELMRGTIAGHIVQLFDTGLSCDRARARSLRDALLARALPYRIGYAAFERRGSPAERSHACWIGLTRDWWRADGMHGWWVFPAGIAYERTFDPLLEAQ